LEPAVREFLRLDEPKKRAYHLYVAGLTYSIYSDSQECAAYAKRKIFKHKAAELLQRSIKVTHAQLAP
jgi:hypothetical protein